MSVYFCNNTELPIEALSVMGVSVKETDNPIGYFGTGLKFAIATLLRTGHTVEIESNGKKFELSLRPTMIRGATFNVVTINGRETGFTDALGRNWEVWQAYRELRSNAMDEGEHYVGTGPYEYFSTTICVTGEGIEKVHSEAYTIFLGTTPLEKSTLAEAHKRQNTYMYYRGVRAGVTQDKDVLFTWNFIGPVSLTEDRTIANIYTCRAYATKTVQLSENAAFITTCLTAAPGCFESTLYYSKDYPYSKTFEDTLRALRHHKNLNSYARDFISAILKKEELYDIITLDGFERKQYDEACAICKKIDVSFSVDPIFVNTLGANILGCVSENQIYISRAAFESGVLILAGTLYEEYLHQHLGLIDESRSMQHYLINKITSMAARRV